MPAAPPRTPAAASAANAKVRQAAVLFFCAQGVKPPFLLLHLSPSAPPPTAPGSYGRLLVIGSSPAAGLLARVKQRLAGISVVALRACGLVVAAPSWKEGYGWVVFVAALVLEWPDCRSLRRFRSLPEAVLHLEGTPRHTVVKLSPPEKGAFFIVQLFEVKLRCSQGHIFIRGKDNQRITLPPTQMR